MFATQSRKMRVGIGQMYVQPGDADANLRRATEMIADAAKRNCALIVLPECLDLGWTFPNASSYADTIPGQFSELLCRAADRFGIYVVAGLTERDGEKLYNSAVLISPKGELLHKHRKINELSFARKIYSVGTSVDVIATSLGTLGVTVCSDNAPDSLELGHTLGKLGANILVSPCAWAVPPDYDNHATPYGAMWKTAYAELARAHRMPVIGVSNVGPVIGGEWDGWECIGCSLVVGGDGETVAQGPYGVRSEQLLVVEVDVQ